VSREAQAQLKAFIDKFDAVDAKRIRAARKFMRALLPTAHELVYDNYNFFVIGYSPTLRPSDAVFSLAAGASGLGLAFLQGAKLPDPKKRLLGAGTVNRFVRLPTLDVLEDPDVEALIELAIARAKVPFAKDGKGTLVIRSVSAKQRPRRKAKA